MAESGFEPEAMGYEPIMLDQTTLFRNTEFPNRTGIFPYVYRG